MTGATEALIERLVLAVPALRARLDEYRAADLVDALPQIFLDETTRELVDRVESGDARAVAELTAVANHLEAEFGTAGDVDELIASCFVVLMPYSKDAGADLVRLLGPKLTAELNRQREWRTPPAHVAFIERLLQAVPALQSLADANRAGNYDDVLTHMFLGDVVNREVERHLSGDAGARSEVRAVFDIVEAEFGRDDEVDNAIAASFVENLPYDGEPGADIAGLLGPKLTAEMSWQRPSAGNGSHTNGTGGG